MPVLILKNGRRMQVARAAPSGADGVIVTLPDGGSFAVPAAQVARVENDGTVAQRPAQTAMARPGFWPDPNLGRPTSESPPFVQANIPIGLPENSLDLGYRSDEFDMERAARDAAGYPEREGEFSRLAEAYNQQRPTTPFDTEGALSRWRGFWQDQVAGGNWSSEDYD